MSGIRWLRRRRRFPLRSDSMTPMWQCTFSAETWTGSAPPSAALSPLPTLQRSRIRSLLMAASHTRGPWHCDGHEEHARGLTWRPPRIRWERYHICGTVLHATFGQADPKLVRCVRKAPGGADYAYQGEQAHDTHPVVRPPPGPRCARHAHCRQDIRHDVTPRRATRWPANELLVTTLRGRFE